MNDSSDNKTKLMTKPFDIFGLVSSISLLLICSLFISSFTYANEESFKEELSTVEISWEKVPGAIEYELELTPVSFSGNKTTKRSKKPETNLSLKPGDYHLRIRSIEKGSQLSNWSDPVDLAVYTVKIKPLKPADKSRLVSQDGKSKDVHFEWSPSAKAKKYVLRIWTRGTRKPIVKKTRKNEATVNLPAQKIFAWDVQAIGKKGINYNSSTQKLKFQILGEELDQPEVIVPLPPVKNIGWIPSKGAQAYRVSLHFRKILDKSWQQLIADKVTRDFDLSLEEPLLPGEYRVELTALSKKNLHSQKSSKIFLVKPTLSQLQAIP